MNETLSGHETQTGHETRIGSLASTRLFRLSMESIQRTSPPSFCGPHPSPHLGIMLEFTTLELLQGLDALLHSNAPRDEIARWTVHIAERAGARAIKRQTLIAIQAACRFICKPHLFPSPARAAEASGCDRRRCTEWIAKIGSRISAEPAMASLAPNAAWQRSFQAAVTYAPEGADGTPTCSFDETSALHGAVVSGRRETDS